MGPESTDWTKTIAYKQTNQLNTYISRYLKNTETN